MASPVSSISIVFFVELIARTTATAGVVQKSPTLTPEKAIDTRCRMTIPGVANEDFSEAKTISHIETNWQPAAVARPFTDAITFRFEFAKN